jgi:hypothetical protein
MSDWETCNLHAVGALTVPRSQRGCHSEHVSRCATAVPRVGFRPLQVQDFTHASKVASVRAGYRQVIDVVPILVEYAFRPYNSWFSGPAGHSEAFFPAESCQCKESVIK